MHVTVQVSFQSKSLKEMVIKVERIAQLQTFFTKDCIKNFLALKYQTLVKGDIAKYDSTNHFRYPQDFLLVIAIIQSNWFLLKDLF